MKKDTAILQKNDEDNRKGLKVPKKKAPRTKTSRFGVNESDNDDSDKLSVGTWSQSKRSRSSDDTESEDSRTKLARLSGRDSLYHISQS